MKMNDRQIQEKAKRYEEYINGFAYIPYQDLPLYEKAFKKYHNL